MWGLYFAPGPVRNFAQAQATDTALFARWHRAALGRGVFLAPSAFEAGFLSIPHTAADIDTPIPHLHPALDETAPRHPPPPPPLRPAPPPPPRPPAPPSPRPPPPR